MSDQTLLTVGNEAPEVAARRAEIRKQLAAQSPQYDRLKYVETGNKAGPTIIFIHGWPDTPLVWQHQLAVLEPTHRCICLTLPGYDEDPKSLRSPGACCCGTKFSDLGHMAATTIKAVMAGRPKEDEKPLLVAHDWGANVGYQVMDEYPHLIAKCVMLDIGQHLQPSCCETLFILMYQWVFSLLFLLPACCGTPLVRKYAKAFGAPDLAPVTNRMNFVYFKFWGAAFTCGLPRSSSDFRPPQCPTLFLYGTVNKPAMFHSEKFEKFLNERPGSAAVGIPADHWLYVRPETRDDVNRRIVDFFVHNSTGDKKKGKGTAGPAAAPKSSATIV